MLNNALMQTGWREPALDEATWRLTIAARLHDTDWTKVMADVRPFLEPGAGGGLLSRDNLWRVLRLND